MQDLVIIGAGGVGREVAWVIEQINNLKPTFNVLGYVDDNEALHGNNINGHKILGGIDYLLNMNNNISVICAIANYKVKKNIINKLSLSEFQYPSIIHPDVYINNTNTVGKGCVIYPGVIVTTNIKVGDYVIISPKCGIGHQVVIEDYCSVLWNVNISGNVKIEEGCLIGSGATIIQNRVIGRETIVGAGAVVVNNIPGNCTAVGIPAKVISEMKRVMK